MKMCKKYACHRVYDSYHHYLNQSVVAISSHGEVLSVTSLSEETSFTEWIGGIIILSHLTEIPLHTDFQELIHHLTSHTQSPLYAWHVSDFDFQQEIISPQSIIRRL